GVHVRGPGPRQHAGPAAAALAGLHALAGAARERRRARDPRHGRGGPGHALAVGGQGVRVRPRDHERARPLTPGRSDGPMTKLEITSSQLSRHLWTRQGFDATEEPRPAAQVIEAVPGVYGAAPTCYLSVL